MPIFSPNDEIEKFKSDRITKSDDDLIEELRSLAPLPDESDSAWEDDEVSRRAYLLVALADMVGGRKLERGIGLVLDKMSYGDPGETMRGMRHPLEQAVDRRWNRLASICVERCASDRPGTRYWALNELGVLRDPATLPTIVKLIDDPGRDIAIEAMQSATMMLQRHPELRGRVIDALRRLAHDRRELREDALGYIRDIQREAPAHGRISDAAAESKLAEAVRQYRDTHNEVAVAFAVEVLLCRCLEKCDEWEGVRATDGVLPKSVELTPSGGLELRGHMTWLPDSAIDPISASIQLDPSAHEIEKAIISLGDADIGLGAARHEGRWPDVANVKRWVFVFTK